MSAGADYQDGDYLVVQPQNPPESVRRVVAHFGPSDNDLVAFTGSSKKFLLVAPTSVGAFLPDAVELASPVSKATARDHRGLRHV